MKLLTVDDSEVMRTLIANAAEVLGLPSLGAASAEEALDILTRDHREFALILLDSNLPGMSGLDFLHRVKAHPAWANIPVMMVTAESDPSVILKAVQEGAAMYLPKPFSTEDLIAKIMQCLDNVLPGDSTAGLTPPAS
ncbi:MAG: response regulator [Lentisphaerae bacterium]|nr:response regulator [Lentisphaerota bacterium]